MYAQVQVFTCAPFDREVEGPEGPSSHQVAGGVGNASGGDNGDCARLAGNIGTSGGGGLETKPET